MVWLNPGDYIKQVYKELRLYAPENERIRLDFNPLRISDEADWNPRWEEWHCYCEPLRIYKQDYELLLEYFNKVYPIKDAFDGTTVSAFDVCFDNWIGEGKWRQIICEIEKDMDDFSDGEKAFFQNLIAWLTTALKYTAIIVVEGNL